jgi:hypothetical protein
MPRLLFELQRNALKKTSFISMYDTLVAEFPLSLNVSGVLLPASPSFDGASAPSPVPR